MHITPILLINRKAMASVFLVFILVGIVFTAYVPYRLKQQEADNALEREKIREEYLNFEKDKENLLFYPIPHSQSNTINFTIKNECELTIGVNLFWINDTSIIVNEVIPSMSSLEFGPYDFEPKEGGKYDMSVSSNRGNNFPSHIGTLYFSGGLWVNELIGFRLIFPSKQNCYKMNPLAISVKNDDGFVYEDEVVYWCISASETFYELGEAGEYRLILEAKNKTLYNATHVIDWPLGDPILEIKFVIDGDHLELG